MPGLRYTFIFIFCAFCSTAISQDYKKFVKTADKLYAKGDINSAIKFYRRADRIKPGNAKINLKLGLSYLSSDYKQKALPILNKVYKINPKVDPDINFYLGLAYQHSHDYQAALSQYRYYKERNKKMSPIANRKIQECLLGDSLLSHPLDVEINNLGSQVNSEFHDYTPLITSDGSTMVFTSRRKGSTGNLKAPDKGYFEDIYITHQSKEGWTKPEKISPNINFEYHDAAAAISPDGRTLFIYYEDGGGDIYSSRYVSGEWTSPEPLNQHINTGYWETAVSITADGQTLYFTSDRPGGYGGLDIYMSNLAENGEWGRPVNLGEHINTPGHEDSPFIHPDGKSLYFSSDGHVGLGGYDIFRSDLGQDGWKRPVNIGFPINTADDDSHFVISSDRKTAYYTSIKEEGVGLADIYKISIHEKTDEAPVKKARPQKKEKKKEESLVGLQKDLGIVTLLKGKVLDAKTAMPLGAKITLVHNTENTVVAEIEADPVTGEFEVTIPHGGNYGLSTERAGYLFNSINFNLPVFDDFQEVDTHILLVWAEVGSKVILKNIFFDTGRSDLRTESLAELERIKKLLNENPNLKVQINGHTDNVGNATYNKILSKKRAQSVVDYLGNNGIDLVRLTAKGFGEERPLVSNDDEKDGREINRRTEIEILEN